MHHPLEPIRWDDGTLVLLDQTRLPAETHYLHLTSVDGVVEAIKALRVRGAPAIGIAAAYGMALAAVESGTRGRIEHLVDARERLARSRPTAVNLFWALERVDRAIEDEVARHGERGLGARILHEARAIHAEDRRMNEAMGRRGAALIEDGARILTHCNTGALATGGWGTALGIIRTAHADGKRVHVYVDETRPLLQGSRLTAYELAADGIPCTLITDSMAAVLLRAGKVDLAIVGADRITANGDTANKIGTYGVAVQCRHHGVPFYVAAPTSTIDLRTASGADIPIEERDPDEVRRLSGVPTAPPGVHVFNPAFDVTPASYIAAIVTERGIVRPPWRSALADIMKPAHHG